MITAKAMETLGNDIGLVIEKQNSLEKKLGKMDDKLDELMKHADVTDNTTNKIEEGPEKATPHKPATR